MERALWMECPTPGTRARAGSPDASTKCHLILGSPGPLYFSPLQRNYNIPGSSEQFFFFFFGSMSAW